MVDVATAKKASTADIRTWARKQGMEVGDRGRLSPEVLEAYGKAHGLGAPTSGGGSSAPAKKAPTKKAPAKKAAAKAPAKKVAKAPAKAALPTKPAPAKAESPLARKAAAAKSTASATAASPSEKPADKPAAKPAEKPVELSPMEQLQKHVEELKDRVAALEKANAERPKKKGLFRKG